MTIPTGGTVPPSDLKAASSDTELLATLFDLGREVTSVLNLDELLEKIPQLISRLTTFTVFSVYLLDEKRGDLYIAYAVGYPEDVVKNFRLQVGEGVVGTAVAEQRPILVGDVSAEPRWMGVVKNVHSGLAVPLRHKGKVLGALNLLSDQKNAFTERDEAMLRQFGAHVAQAIVNARLFASEQEYSATLETLAEIGHEMSAILDLNELLTRVAHLVKRLIAYRTFGIALLDDTTQMLDLKIAISYSDAKSVEPVKIGEGLIGYAALHKEHVLVPDVSKDSRYINAVSDVRSELVIPLLIKDRCIGVFDLESPELDAFSKKHVELLTLLASQAAVAIENARLYVALRDNEVRLEKEVRFAQRVQMALLPQELPKKLKGVDVAWHFDPARELGGDVYEFLSPEFNTLVVAVGDVSGKGVPAALYSSFVGEVVRGRTYRRRFTPERGSPAAVLTSLNRILHERQLEEYFCTLCYSVFDLKKRAVTFANSGFPYPAHISGDTTVQIVQPGLPLGSFGASTYDDITVELKQDDVFVFASDGISETFNASGEEFGSERVMATALETRHKPAKEIVEAIFGAMRAFRGDAEQTDDQTVVVVRITS
ncbi:MAG TPA: GAF domain-containing SpoIIE family protein phosphatase [Vicinamibacterales bacterium]|nr:GAF domain-containing SpoIIE family protein phosphatase [Vicinamibacterales bacterium]